MEIVITLIPQRPRPERKIAIADATLSTTHASTKYRQIMNSLTIRKRVSSGFSIIILISAAAGLFGFWKLTVIDQNADHITEANLPRLTLIGEVSYRMLLNQGLALKHIIATDNSRIESLDQEISKGSETATKILTSYENALTDPKDRELISTLKAARLRVGEVRDNIVLPLSRQGRKAEAAEAFETKLEPLYLSFTETMKALKDFNSKSCELSGVSIQHAIESGKLGIAIGTVFSFLAGGLIAFTIIRTTGKVLEGVTSVLNESSDQLASASMQVSSSSQTLAEGASEQAASLEETSASLEEISSMTRRNAENAHGAKELTSQARNAAEGGAFEMMQMAGAMSDIQQASDNISKIIKTIDEIAFQTNILALNAAVEAARAGEAGMGFAVVADEVRNLAQRSAQAAKETAEKIEDCIRKSEAGVTISSKVRASLQGIVTKVAQVDELVAEIATASREQSQGIDQVNTALTQMDKVTQSNAASAEESASAAEELTAQAQALKEAVGELKKLVGAAIPARAKAGAAEGGTSGAFYLPKALTTFSGASSANVVTRIESHSVSKISKVNGVNGTNGKVQMSLSPFQGRSIIPLKGEF